MAFVMEEEPVPLVTTDSFVFIKPAARSLDEQSDLVFEGGAMSGRLYGPVNLRWQKNGSLWIGYCDGGTNIYRNNWSDSHSSAPVQLEVLLEREQQGQWAASGPPKGSAGPPPCP